MGNLALTYWNQGRWEEAEETGRASNGDSKNKAWGRSSRHANQHRQPGVDVLEPRPVGGDREAGGASNGDSKNKAWGRSSRHANQHGRPGVDVLEPRPVGGGREAGRARIETRKIKLGADHPRTLPPALVRTSMANLASTYRNQGRWEEAEKLDVQVMETGKIKLGADHPDTLTSIASFSASSHRPCFWYVDATWRRRTGTKAGGRRPRSWRCK